jgi:NhaP-type Na+/H+ or K+/H+ antiporter
MKYFKDNIMEIMAIGAMLQFLLVCLLILFKQVKATEPTTMMILTSSTNFVVIVLSFYFGSSKGSKDKQIQLDKQNL